MNYYYDCEFLDDGVTIELVSIGMVDDDGRELYAESSEVDLSKANDWVKANVIPHLWSRQLDVSPGKIAANEWSRDGGRGGLLCRRDIAHELRMFCDPERYGKIVLYGYYSAYDHVVLCQLFGPMIDLPKGWPMFTIDLIQECKRLGNPQLPSQGKGEHHSLQDAKWNRQIFYFLKDYRRDKIKDLALRAVAESGF